MAEVNTLSAAAFEAIAEAQSTYGVPDRMIARIAQCSDTQITRNRKLVGWSLRKVTTAYLRGQAPMAQSLPSDMSNLINSGLNIEEGGYVPPFEETNAAALRKAIERLMWKLSQELAVKDAEDIDPLSLKRLEGIGAAAKHFEKLLELRSRSAVIATETGAKAQHDPVETARILKKIEKRVHELAEEKARDIVLESIERNGDAHSCTGMDDQRSSQANSAGPA